MERKMKPGDIEVSGGKIISIAKWRPPQGRYVHRMLLNGCVWHRHLVDREYRCKIVGDKLWPLKKGEKVNPKVIQMVCCTECVGLELVSTMEHWWLDTEIRRPPLQNEDWLMAHYFAEHTFDSRRDARDESWQLPWAWQYECWREHQPWSDFDQWRKEWRQEVKRLRDPDNDWICGRRSRKECEEVAGFHSRLPLWLLRDFADCFPKTPWTAISSEDREKRLAKTGITRESGYRNPPSLEGSVLALKESDPDSVGFPPIPEKLRNRHDGWHSLRQPDPNNAEEIASYSEWQRKNSEALQHHQKWLDALGHYRNEAVEETSPGYFHGTYVIHVPWYWPDDVLDRAWIEWREKKARQLKGRHELSFEGRMKWQDWLRQLGALRLLRVMTAEKARKLTAEVTKGAPLYKEPKDWYTARRRADCNLAKHFGVA